MDTVDIVMPMFSETMEEGTILEWLKEIGDPIRSGEDLVEVETDKATMVYASDTTGELVEILGASGDTLPVGAVIARIAVPAGAARRPSAAASTSAPFEPAGTTIEADTPVAAPSSGASAAAHATATRLGIDLASVTGSGRNGEITRRDVEAMRGDATGAAPAGGRGNPTGAVPSTTRELSPIERTAARRLGEAAGRVPQFDLEVDLDVGAALDALSDLRSQDPATSPTIGDLVVRLTAVALRDHPLLNASFVTEDSSVRQYEQRNVGIAVSTAQGLLVPTIFEADTKPIAEIARESKALAEKARAGALTASDLSGGTFTISNLGMFAVGRFRALVNPPQSAILAIGTVRKQPGIVDGVLGELNIMSVTLGCDHRAMQGTDGAQFLQRLQELFTDPRPHLGGGPQP